MANAADQQDLCSFAIRYIRQKGGLDFDLLPHDRYSMTELAIDGKRCHWPVQDTRHDLKHHLWSKPLKCSEPQATVSTVK